MSTDEDWLFRPVTANMIDAKSLIDGSVDLEYIARLNEALDVRYENEDRMRDK